MCLPATFAFDTCTALLICCTLHFAGFSSEKAEIFSILQITNIEQYFAFVFMHATETSILLKINKTSIELI